MTVFLAHMRATLMVHGFHFELPESVVRVFLSGGRQVDIFFVLSGFILSMNYRAWFSQKLHFGAYATFLRRRIARIYPLHVVMLLFTIAFVVAAAATGATSTYGLERFQNDDLPANFLMMQAWGFFFQDSAYWNPPAWSISIEFLAYLVFPLFVWLIARGNRLNSWIPVALGVAIGFGLNYLTPWGIAGFGGIARGGSEFLLGCVLINLYGSRTAAWLQTNVGSLAAAGLLLLCYLLTPDTSFAVAVCAAPLLLTLARNNVVSRVIGCRPIFFLGKISYSIYLGHFLLSSIAYRLVSATWMKAGAIQTSIGVIVFVGFVLGVSTCLYYLVERPGRQLLGGRRRTPAASRVVPTEIPIS